VRDDSGLDRKLLAEAERRAIASGRPLSQELLELRNPPWPPRPLEGGLFEEIDKTSERMLH
jgi:hypothetical protein